MVLRVTSALALALVRKSRPYPTATTVRDNEEGHHDRRIPGHV